MIEIYGTNLGIGLKTIVTVNHTWRELNNMH